MNEQPSSTSLGEPATFSISYAQANGRFILRSRTRTPSPASLSFAVDEAGESLFCSFYGGWKKLSDIPTLTMYLLLRYNGKLVNISNLLHEMFLRIAQKTSNPDSMVPTLSINSLTEVASLFVVPTKKLLTTYGAALLNQPQ